MGGKKVGLELNLWGSVLGSSGYAIHTKNLAKALIEQGVDLCIQPSEAMPENWRDFVSPAIEDAINKEFHTDKPYVAITIPPMWLTRSGEREDFYGFGVFEGDKVPSHWYRIGEEKFVKSILVPSKHTKKAWKKSGTKKRIDIIPHGYDEKIYYPTGPKIPDVSINDDTFKFGYVGGWKDGVYDRKGLDHLLKAFCNKFKKDEKVSLHCKINMSYQPPEVVTRNVDALGLPPMENRPKMSLYMNEWTEEMMAQFYRTIDVLVIPTKADAFCMPYLEALACGTPVIATDFGGQTDFVNNKNGWISKTKGLAQATGGYMYEETKWAVVDKEDIGKLMRHCFKNKKEVKKKGKEGEKVRENWTWTHSAKKLIKTIFPGR